MSDKEKLKELLDNFGIGYTEIGDDIIVSVGNTNVLGTLSAGAIFEFENDVDFLLLSIDRH